MSSEYGLPHFLIFESQVPIIGMLQFHNNKRFFAEFIIVGSPKAIALSGPDQFRTNLFCNLLIDSLYVDRTIFELASQVECFF